MKIEYLGHSSFRLTESTQKTIVTDPYTKIGYEMPDISADAVTVSHNHYDHNAHTKVGGNPLVISTPGTFDLGGVTVTGISALHDDADGSKRGEVIIYKIHMDGIDICHLGDIGQSLDVELLELILPVNILLIPVGGKYTIDAAQAKEYVDKIMPDIVIPMHFKTRSLNIDIDKVSEFTDLFEDYQIEEAGSSLEFLRDDMDGVYTKVIVMKRLKKDRSGRKGEFDVGI